MTYSGGKNQMVKPKRVRWINGITGIEEVSLAIQQKKPQMRIHKTGPIRDSKR